jgi:hypothetical protein
MQYQLRSFLLTTLFLGMVSILPTQHAQSDNMQPSETQEKLMVTARQAAFRSYIRTRAYEKNNLRASSQTNFPGRWYGTYFLNSDYCGGINRRFNVRHIIRMRRASTAITTSHDGTFYGRSREGGRKLETYTEYEDTDGSYVEAALAYANLQNRRASSGFAARLTDDYGSCEFSYGATMYRY